ncbi:hypothetical protein ALC56_09900 [Trachymyrmex septentrionalis]|uniref:Uncharacterized protein n=1 Tax=Trachymyrmex septentrionalis TaxID=34720 RepID=A0A151JU54_9HYME|nr:hypothetical protein ALC56_09900 [Trachymyrmex septentrionalis]
MRYKEARSCIIRPTYALHLVRSWATNCGKLPRKSGNRAAGCEAQAACRDGEAILQVIIRTDATGGFPVERKHFHVTLQFSRFDDASEEEENVFPLEKRCRIGSIQQGSCNFSLGRLLTQSRSPPIAVYYISRNRNPRGDKVFTSLLPATLSATSLIL